MGSKITDNPNLNL